jgi:periplasmic divalent cation tolerance protein
MTDVVLVLTTVGDAAAAEQLARALVDEQLAACVNVLPAMTSCYRWKGQLEHAAEYQIIIKTTVGRVADIGSRLTGLHPYELPEFLVIQVSDGSAPYLDWVRDGTRQRA